MRELYANLRLRLGALRKRRQLERDLEEEIAFHVAMRGGDTAGFGNPARVKEDLREMWTFPTLESFGQDLRYAARLLRRSPLFSLVAIGSLALGIGANTAIFSLANAVLLKSLPVPDPQQLRLILWAGQPRSPMEGRSGYTTRLQGVSAMSSFSKPLYEQLRERLREQYDLMGFTRSEVTVRAGGESHYAQALFTGGTMAAVLGLRPRLGRLLTPEDDRVGAPAVALISHAYWERRHGLDAGVVGRDITINNQRVRLVGVLPEGFRGLDPAANVDFVFALAQVRDFGPTFYANAKPTHWWIQLLARLRPGVEEAAAHSALAAVMKQIDESYPPVKAPGGGPWRAVVVDGAGGIPLLSQQARQPVLILVCVVGVVLLIACANLANLLLARGAARAREMAVRLSIGSSRWRLVRQLLTESLLLSSLGAGLGLLLAPSLARACLSLYAGGNRLELGLGLDGRALFFTALVTVLTALLFGLAPALRATRTDLTPSLKGCGVGARASAANSRSSRLLVVAQVALCTLLLSAAGLFIRTFTHLSGIDPGFNPRQLTVFNLDATRSGYAGDRLTQFYERVRVRLGEIPGVQSVTHSSAALISGTMSSTLFRFAGDEAATSKKHPAHFLAVGSGFHSVLGIPLREGREITERDTAASPRVAVVNEAFVTEHCGGRSPVGRILYAEGAPGEPDEPPFEIVGVCRNAKYDSLKLDAPATVYLPARQNPQWTPSASFELRSALGVGALSAAVRGAVAEIDANIPVAGVRSQQEQIRLTLGTERMFASLVGAFGLTAALLAAIGLYGLLAYSVARRRAEIGIRLALGAGRREVQWMVVRDSLSMALAGVVLGIPTALALARLVRSSLYGITPADPLSFLAAPALLAALAALAAWLPARQAARVDPASTLRCE